MIAYLREDNKIHLDLTTPEIENQISERFSVEHPNAQYSTAYDMGHWDGVVCLYRKRSKTLSIGFLDALIELCKEKGIPLDVEDSRKPIIHKLIPRDELTTNILPGIELDPHQMRCCHSIYDNFSRRGIHKHITGAGKTECIAAIIKMFPNCPTAVIAEEVIVSQQIQQRLELRKVAGEDGVGAFYAGKRPDGQLVVVGSIQALRDPPTPKRKDDEKDEKWNRRLKAWATRRKNAKILQKIIKKCHLVLIDECDRAVTDSYSDLFNKFATEARYIYGFSGTPFSKYKPVENLILQERLGEVISESGRKEMESLGRIIPVSYTMVAVGEDGDKYDRTTNNDAIKQFMEENDELHEKVLKICDLYKNEGKLILVDRTSLGEALETKIPGSMFIQGKTSLSKRNKAIKAFENRELKILIGSKILMRGLDLKGGTENLVLCYDGKSDQEFLQRIGRAVRRNEKGSARVFDFFFFNNYYLYRHSRDRLKHVVESGYTTYVLFVRSGIRITGEDLIKRKFRVPKPKK